ncbi:MAG: DegT/DnrJ/EryC1/StrS family aminotransferase [bacterium]
MLKTLIPFHRPLIDQSDIDNVLACLQSGWLTTGSRANAFEEKFAAYIGAPHAVAVNSCTAAMHLALAALGIQAGDEVITSPMTFVATCEAIQYLGARPAFIDVEPDTLNLDPARLPAALSERTRALVPVHMAGHPADLPALLEFAERHNLKVMEDAAHAVEAAIMPAYANGALHPRGIGKIGSISAATCFSFYATKNVTTAEGGMVTCADEALAAHMRRLSLHGLSRDAWKRYTASGSWYYEVIEQGYKNNLTDLAAALGLSQLAKTEAMWQRRAEIAARYHAAFAELPELEIPTARKHVRHAWHLYILKLHLNKLVCDRNQFFEALRARGICCSVHFIPLHLMPFYREQYGYQRGDFPEAERQFERIVSLPLYPALTDAEVDRVIASVQEVVYEHRRARLVQARREQCELPG